MQSYRQASMWRENYLRCSRRYQNGDVSADLIDLHQPLISKITYLLMDTLQILLGFFIGSIISLTRPFDDIVCFEPNAAVFTENVWRKSIFIFVESMDKVHGQLDIVLLSSLLLHVVRTKAESNLVTSKHIRKLLVNMTNWTFQHRSFLQWNFITSTWMNSKAGSEKSTKACYIVWVGS